MSPARFMARRLSDAQRVPAFGAVSIVLVSLAAAALVALPHHGSARRTVTASVRPQQPLPAPAPAPDRNRIVADARSFMSGYLSYLYAGADAQTIPRVSISLRRTLARHARPRGRGGPERRRLLDVQILTVTRSRAHVVATATDDSGATFPIGLRLDRVPVTGWVVSDLDR